MVKMLILAVIFYAAINGQALAVHGPGAVITASRSAVDLDFDRAFREGKDLIDREEWGRAVEKFRELIVKYPANESIDAVLYWLALAYKKQNAPKQADAVLDRLLKEFPESPWAADGRVMKAEIAGTLPAARRDKPAVERGSGRALVEPTSFEHEREEEIKLAAFQSMLSADQEKAVKTISDLLLLGEDFAAHENLKLEMLRALTRARLLNIPPMDRFIPELRATLREAFLKESNIKVRKEIIYTLAKIFDEQSIRQLSEFYAAETNKDLKKWIIDSFNNPYRNANNFITPNNYSRFSVIQKLEADKLMEILQTERDADLRRLAFYKLQRIGISKRIAAGNGPVAVGAIIKLYENEQDEELKLSFVRFFRDIKQNQATKKLLEIAKTENSEKLRTEAIGALRTSKDPEVISFLEELTKQN